MNRILAEFQELDKDWYDGFGIFWNLELVPAEGATRRLAQQMHKYYPEAITSNGSNKDYLTRGCWLPADEQYSLKFAAEHQDKLQDKFSGGANFQYFTESPIDDWKVVRSIIKKLVMNTSLPFISISPMVNMCPICGNRIKNGEKCMHELTQDDIKEYKQQGVEFDEFNG
jgi:ribonucleoside-triphosphate reductase